MAPSAYKEPAPSKQPEVPIEITTAYIDMRKELAGKVDSSISILNTYADFFKRSGQSGKKEDLVKWQSLETITLQSIRSLKQLKNDIPDKAPEDYAQAVAEIMYSAVAMDRTLAMAYSAVWTQAPLPNISGSDMKFFLQSIADNADTTSKHAGELYSAEYFKSTRGEFTYGGKYDGPDGKQYVYLLNKGQREDAVAKYADLRDVLQLALAQYSKGGDSAKWEMPMTFQDAQKYSDKISEKIGRKYASNMANYTLDRSREGKPWYQNTGNFFAYENPWIGDLAVAGIAVAAELGTAGLATPAVAAGTGAYFMGRGAQEMMYDVAQNGRMTMQGAMGAAMLVTPMGKLAGVFKLADAGVAGRFVTAGANIASGTAGTTLVVAGLWDAGKIVSNSSKYGFTMQDLEALAINFSFMAIGGVSMIKALKASELTRAVDRGNYVGIVGELQTRAEMPTTKNAEILSDAAKSISALGADMKTRDGRIGIYDGRASYVELSKSLRGLKDPEMARLADFMDSQLALAGRQAQAVEFAQSNAKYFKGAKSADAQVSQLEDAHYQLGSGLAEKYLSLIVERVRSGQDWGTVEQIKKYNSNKLGFTPEDFLGAYQTKQRLALGQDVTAVQSPDVLSRRAQVLDFMGDKTGAQKVRDAIGKEAVPTKAKAPMELPFPHEGQFATGVAGPDSGMPPENTTSTAALDSTPIPPGMGEPGSVKAGLPKVSLITPSGEMKAEVALGATAKEVYGALSPFIGRQVRMTLDTGRTVDGVLRIRQGDNAIYVGTDKLSFFFTSKEITGISDIKILPTKFEDVQARRASQSAWKGGGVQDQMPDTGVKALEADARRVFGLDGKETVEVRVYNDADTVNARKQWLLSFDPSLRLNRKFGTFTITDADGKTRKVDAGCIKVGDTMAVGVFDPLAIPKAAKAPVEATGSRPKAGAEADGETSGATATATARARASAGYERPPEIKGVSYEQQPVFEPAMARDTAQTRDSLAALRNQLISIKVTLPDGRTEWRPCVITKVFPEGVFEVANPVLRGKRELVNLGAKPRPDLPTIEYAYRMNFTPVEMAKKLVLPGTTKRGDYVTTDALAANARPGQLIYVPPVGPLDLVAGSKGLKSGKLWAGRWLYIDEIKNVNGKQVPYVYDVTGLVNTANATYIGSLMLRYHFGPAGVAQFTSMLDLSGNMLMKGAFSNLSNLPLALGEKAIGQIYNPGGIYTWNIPFTKLPLPVPEKAMYHGAMFLGTVTSEVMRFGKAKPLEVEAGRPISLYDPSTVRAGRAVGKVISWPLDQAAYGVGYVAGRGGAAFSYGAGKGFTGASAEGPIAWYDAPMYGLGYGTGAVGAAPARAFNWMRTGMRQFWFDNVYSLHRDFWDNVALKTRWVGDTGLKVRDWGQQQVVYLTARVRWNTMSEYTTEQLRTNPDVLLNDLGTKLGLPKNYDQQMLGQAMAKQKLYLRLVMDDGSSLIVGSPDIVLPKPGETPEQASGKTVLLAKDYLALPRWIMGYRDFSLEKDSKVKRVEVVTSDFTAQGPLPPGAQPETIIISPNDAAVKKAVNRGDAAAVGIVDDIAKGGKGNLSILPEPDTEASKQAQIASIDEAASRRNLASLETLTRKLSADYEAPDVAPVPEINAKITQKDLEFLATIPSQIGEGLADASWCATAGNILSRMSNDTPANREFAKFFARTVFTPVFDAAALDAGAPAVQGADGFMTVPKGRGVDWSKVDKRAIWGISGAVALGAIGVGAYYYSQNSASTAQREQLVTPSKPAKQSAQPSADISDRSQSNIYHPLPPGPGQSATKASQPKPAAPQSAQQPTSPFMQQGPVQTKPAPGPVGAFQKPADEKPATAPTTQAAVPAYVPEWAKAENLKPAQFAIFFKDEANRESYQTRLAPLGEDTVEDYFKFYASLNETAASREKSTAERAAAQRLLRLLDMAAKADTSKFKTDPLPDMFLLMTSDKKGEGARYYIKGDKDTLAQIADNLLKPHAQRKDDWYVLDEKSKPIYLDDIYNGKYAKNAKK